MKILNWASKNIYLSLIWLISSVRCKANRFRTWLILILEFFHKRRALESGRFKCNWNDRKLCLSDATVETAFDSHYVYHTAWAARKLKMLSPTKHIDISSCLRFVSIASAFCPIEFYDFRPPDLCLTDLTATHADITALLFEDNSVFSISCMHVVEHIGLQRYGDKFDPEGDLKAVSELKRVIAPGGHLLFVVPVGEVPIVQYNAHRIYNYNQVIELFDGFDLHEFSYVNDIGRFVENTSNKACAGQKYGCGCFHFLKK